MSGQWDERVYNDAQMCEKLVAHLGAVILNPASKPPVGFAPRSTHHVETYHTRPRPEGETRDLIRASINRSAR